MTLPPGLLKAQVLFHAGLGLAAQPAFRVGTRGVSRFPIAVAPRGRNR
jgi:hypothetical protein